MKQLHCGRIIDPALTAAPKSHPWIILWSKAGYKLKGLLTPVLPAALRPGRKHKPKASLPRNNSTPVLLSYPTKHTDPVEIVHCKVFSQTGFFESAF